MSKWIITVLAGSLFFMSYFAYNCWEDEIAAKKEAAELSNKLQQLEQKRIKDNEIIRQNELIKISLENKSREQQEQINELLKNNRCTNEFVPDDVSNKLLNRAINIRQSSDTSKPIN